MDSYVVIDLIDDLSSKILWYNRSGSTENLGG